MRAGGGVRAELCRQERAAAAATDAAAAAAAGRQAASQAEGQGCCRAPHLPGEQQQEEVLRVGEGAARRGAGAPAAYVHLVLLLPDLRRSTVTNSDTASAVSLLHRVSKRSGAKLQHAPRTGRRALPPHL